MSVTVPSPVFESLDETELVGDLLLRSAHHWPERVALVHGDRSVAYETLLDGARRVARLVSEHGVRRGDRVVLLSDNRVEFVECYFAILLTGAVAVPINPLLRSGEIAHVVANCDASLILTIPDEADLDCETQARSGAAALSVPVAVIGTEAWRARASAAAAATPVRVDPDDIAVIIYTSGTTGRSRGAELRHRNIRDNAVVGGRLFECDPQRPDVTLCALPMYHSFGQSGMQNTTLAFGGTLVLANRFDALEVLDLMKRWGVTYFGGVPTMYWRLVDTLSEGTEGLDLRVALSGGAALSVQLHQDFQRRFGITITEGYGLSETSPLACTCLLGEVRPGSIGRPVPGVEMRLIDSDDLEVRDGIGEIAIRGHNVMRGYHGMPEATAAVLRNGWLSTGDLARRDDEGFYYIVDRAKDLVIRGGFNVYPREVEEVLSTHPDVSLVAVVGVPHAEHGEEIKAFVVPRSGHRIDTDALRVWAKEQMAAYKYPRVIEVCDSLPLGPTGKILKRALRSHA